MLATHRTDRLILAAMRRLRQPATFGEIAREIADVENESVSQRTVERHVRSLCLVGVVFATASLRDGRAVKTWQMSQIDAGLPNCGRCDS